MADRAFRDQIRTLGEDTVSYALYAAPQPQAAAAVAEGSAISGSQATFETLQVTKALALSIAQRLTKGYLWHQDAFSLRVDSGKRLGNDQGVPCLRGKTRFGDCLDDEWMIVYVLREITRQIPGVIARVWDNDGEFLLIEAADHLPGWLDPDNSENRVFIYNGQLHIISPPAPGEDKDATVAAERGSRARPPQLAPALSLIRRVNDRQMVDGGNPVRMALETETETETVAAKEMQRAAFGPVIATEEGDEQRQSFAVHKIQEQKHYARCKVPSVVARLLQTRPELVTRACNAFYTRDAMGLAACGRMDKFLPVEDITTTTSRIQVPPAEAQRQRIERARMVTTAVCFTRTCYAQLVSQPFQPPKSWNGIVPPPDPLEARDVQKVKEAELGMKLTCGFEILCSPDYSGDFGRRIGEEIQLEQFPFATDYDWRVFKSTLNFRQYFGNERPGSQEYRRLEEQAKRQFLESKMERDREDLLYSSKRMGQGSSSSSGAGADPGLESNDDVELDDHTTSFFGHGYHPVEEVDKLLTRWREEGEDEKADNFVDDRPSDDDGWMTVSLADLEAMMHAKGLRDPSLGNSANGGGQGDNDDVIGMEDVLGKFESFVQHGRGGIEGAEFLDEQSDDDADTDDDSEAEEVVKNAKLEDSGQDDDVVEDEDDEDMFASDYEERIAAKQAKKSSSKRLTSTSLFVFEDHAGGGLPMNTVSSNASQEQRLTLSADNIQQILADKFGVTRSTLPARRTLSESESRKAGVEGGEVGDDEDGQDIRRYMAELDAELAGTKIGESFERTVPVVSGGHQSKGKGKGKAPAKEETLGKTGVVELGEETLKTGTRSDTKTTLEAIEESIARTKRGQAVRRGGPMDGRTYGYDPMAGDVEDSSGDEHDTTMRQETMVKKGKQRQQQQQRRRRDVEEDEEDVAASEVNVDVNLAKNLLESFKSQGGLPGPGSNLLGRLGIVLPRDEGDSEDESDNYKDVAYEEEEESDDGDPRY
ncbi:hypothetical protein DFQ27_005496 [Actinomortierella ambigua]|uniref:Uncharacterized protein n=1 Tax=Actinomortierella ambigua TaxID=1343610 RepID=A0A9P6U2T4_9FUNG|nr:hypothetical protein DFQ27_005496 [Actinomortierella ambigua]